MRRLYWRPAGPSGRALLAIAAFSVLLLLFVEHLPLQIEQAAQEEKLRAAETAQRAFEVLREEREQRGLEIDRESDPARTGMIGVPATEVTTTSGSLTSKRTTANPNFAAVIVDFLHRLEVEQDDLVAVGYSGSFPAMNVAVLSAIDAMDLEATIIASATASDWGASYPSFMWLDMERVLRERGVLEEKSIAASMGGIEDQGIGLSETGRHLVERTISRNEVSYLEVESFDDSLDRRMELYDQAAKGRPYSAYVNIGGGAVSVGRSRGKSLYRPGINRPGPKAPVDSIIGRFLDRGVPVVHLVHMKSLARQYGLPVDPQRTPPVGHGGVFRRTEPNVWLANLALLALLGSLYFVGRRARARAHLKTLPEGVVVDSRASEARKR